MIEARWRGEERVVGMEGVERAGIPGVDGFFHQIDVLSGAIQINPAISFYLVRSRDDLAYWSRFSFLLRAARA